jgi:glycerate 2-kinase
MARRTLDELRRDAEAIAVAGIEGADAGRLVLRAVRREENRVWFHPREPYNLDAFERVIVAGAGKAAGPMAQALEAVLGDRISGGCIALPAGPRRSDLLKRIDVVEAEHPLPGPGSLRAAEAIATAVRQAGKNDLVVFLVSGGASSLMAAPEEGLELEDLRFAWDALLRAGLSIVEMNVVRKHLMTLGGGKLALLATRATAVSLILSDVPGNHIESVGSGPTAPDPSTFAEVEQILSKVGALAAGSWRLRAFVERGASGALPETPKPGDGRSPSVYHRLVGTNDSAVAAAILKAAELGYRDGGDFLVKSPAPPAVNEARAVGRSFGVYAAYLAETARLGYGEGSAVAVIGGGEAPATVRRVGGWGGRLSEFALAAAEAIEAQHGVVVGGIATDGQDGAWDASGAFADGETLSRAQRAGVSASDVLQSSDSGRIFEAAGGKQAARPTRTNVADLYIALVDSA